MPLDLDGPHWRFSLAAYCAPGVPEACIALQDEYGTDINVLLLFLWMATRRRRAPATVDIARADAAVRDWRTRVVEPLRDVRRAMKSSPVLPRREESEALRKQVKTVELAAEQLEQALLVQHLRVLETGSEASGGDVSPEILATTAERVVAFYASRHRPGLLEKDSRALSNMKAVARSVWEVIE
jgi:uncharacterized protein (TIGR02444 family)